MSISISARCRERPVVVWFGALALCLRLGGGLLQGTDLAAGNASMACAPTPDLLDVAHGCNKFPKARWWLYEDTLRFHIFQYAMEYYLTLLSPLPISSRVSLHNLYYLSWHALSPMLVWQDVWVLLRPQQKVDFIRRTFALDSEFGLSMVDCAYAAQLGRTMSWPQALLEMD